MAEGFITRRGGKGGVDVSDATAVQSDVLQGKTFYAGDETIKTGTIPSKGAETFTPTTTNQTIAANQFLSGTQTILGDADLIPENIREGTTIFNVTGTLTPPPPQFYLSFDGVDDHVNVPHDSSLNLTSQMTLSATVELNQIKTQAIINKNQISDGYELSLSSAGQVIFRMNGLPSSLDLRGGDLSINEIIHITGTYNGSIMRLYINGVEVSTLSTTASISTNNNNLVIGARNNLSGAFFNGNIYNIQIWNKALTSTEINNFIFNLPTGNETGLVAYYKFDEGTGTTLGDSAGNNDGTIVGATWEQ